MHISTRKPKIRASPFLTNLTPKLTKFKGNVPVKFSEAQSINYRAWIFLKRE
jgi:hypothetical protein